MRNLHRMRDPSSLPPFSLSYHMKEGQIGDGLNAQISKKYKESKVVKICSHWNL